MIIKKFNFFQSSCFVILFLVLFISILLCCTYCWTNISQNSIGLVRGGSVIEVDVELIKQEKSVDQKEEIKTISGTEFYLFKATGEQIGSKYVTDENGKINVKLTKGEYYFEEITPAIGYTFDKVDGEKITKYYFTVNGKKNEKVIVDAYNIHLEGSLLINKIVKNKDETTLSEEQLNKEFTFIVTFDNAGEYMYKINDGEEQLLKSGDTLKLKHGETAVFSSIPAGVSYNIKEEFEENYISIGSNHQGVVTDTKSIVTFTNIYDPDFAPSDKQVKVMITKKLAGEYLITEETKEFHFKLLIDEQETNFTLKNNETKEFLIPIGSKYELIEENYFLDGYKQEMTNSIGIAYQDMGIVVTNTYIKEPKKIISGEKIWITNDNPNAILPESIIVRIKNNNLVEEEKKIKPNKDGKWLYEFIVTKYDENNEEINYIIEEEPVDSFITTYDGFNIKNTYIAPVEVKLPILYKRIEGEHYPKTNFEFILKGKKDAMPIGSENDSKIISINDEGNIDFGTIIFTNPGIYTYKVYELDGGVLGWTYDDTIYTITIYINEENGKLTEKVNITSSKEKKADYSFTNIYEEPEQYKKIIISGEVTWEHGKNPQDKRPTFVIINVNTNNNLLIQKQISSQEDWKFSFELPKYDENGNEINYTIDQIDVENYKKSVNGYNIHNKFTGTNKPNTANPDTEDDIEKYFVLISISGVLLLILLLVFFIKKYKKNVT